MSSRPSWMTDPQLRILKSIHESEPVDADMIALSTNTDYQLGYDQGDVVSACEPLLENGFIEEVEPMKYKITQRGQGLLENE